MIPLSKERKTDRILSIAPIPGKKAVSSTGLVDPRLFTGENKLHVVQHPETRLWDFHYDAGAVPTPLKEKYTTFQLALEQAKKYYNSRNCEITGILD